MNNRELLELNQVREFIRASLGISFKPINQIEGYKWIARTLKRLNYFKLSKKDKGTIRAYLKKQSGYSRTQLNRLVSQYRDNRWIGAKC